IRACPALGGEAPPMKTNAVYQTFLSACFGTASQPNAGQARSPHGRMSSEITYAKFKISGSNFNPLKSVGYF
ncbi:hypothetical protein JWR97_02915, partial [Pseudomonas cedrina subsp. fulgida]|nr:hypothetical protein [Pseudomonas cedrina subsp. fulgida]